MKALFMTLAIAVALSLSAPMQYAFAEDNSPGHIIGDVLTGGHGHHENGWHHGRDWGHRDHHRYYQQSPQHHRYYQQPHHYYDHDDGDDE